MVVRVVPPKKLFLRSRFEMHLQLGEARRRHNLMDQFEEASFTNKYYNLTSQATFKNDSNTQIDFFGFALAASGGRKRLIVIRSFP